jgi:hypothetical protein
VATKECELRVDDRAQTLSAESMRRPKSGHSRPMSPMLFRLQPGILIDLSFGVRSSALPVINCPFPIQPSSQLTAAYQLL